MSTSEAIVLPFLWIMINIYKIHATSDSRGESLCNQLNRSSSCANEFSFWDETEDREGIINCAGDNNIIIASEYELNVYDLRFGRTVIQKKLFEGKILDSALVNGTDLWTIENPNKINLLDVGHESTGKVLSNNVETNGCELLELEATKYFLLVSNRVGPVQAFHATLPLKPIKNKGLPTPATRWSGLPMAAKDDAVAIMSKSEAMEFRTLTGGKWSIKRYLFPN